MLIKVASDLYPRARTLAAWKIPLSASMRTLLCPEIHRARINSRYFSSSLSALRTGANSLDPAESSSAYRRNQVRRHFAARRVFAALPGIQWVTG